MEGQFYALPLEVPGECDPIDPDSAHICALAAASDGRLVWGATRGCTSHIFAACFKGAAGGIIDTGMLPENTEGVHLLALPAGHALAGSGSHTVIAGVTTPRGFSLWRQSFTVPRDVVQEPNFCHPAPECIVEPSAGRCLGLGLLDRTVCCLTDGGLFALASGSPGGLQAIHTEAPCPITPLAILNESAWWVDEEGRLTGCLADGTIHSWHPLLTNDTQVTTLIAEPAGKLLAVLPDGCLVALDPETEEITPAGAIPLSHVQCLVPLPDGRVYGLCGSGIGHFFRADLSSNTSAALGAVATAVSNHRYAFTFSCAPVTSDGTILFGEDDRGGHLWMYYPPLLRL